MLNTNLMCDLIINWINQQARKDNSKLQELGEYVCRKFLIKSQVFIEINFRCIYFISMVIKLFTIVLIWIRKIFFFLI